MKVDIPGIGGSLGECVICGQNFAFEVITGERVGMIRVSGLNADLPLHKKCRKNIPKDGDWKKLPDGPLRREFEEAVKQREEKG